MLKNIKKSSGQISTMLLVLAVVLIIIIIVVFVVVKNSATRNAKNEKPARSSGVDGVSQVSVPVYESTIGEIKFTLQFSQNLGSFLKSRDTRYVPNLTTTERFIQVVIGAQNKGKNNIAPNLWIIGNITDSEGRNFIPLDDPQHFFLQDASYNCGSLLKPEFEPVSCTKIYEVSKASRSLRVAVTVMPTSKLSKQQDSFIDLDILHQ